jgi:hypothetical protein
MSGALDPSRWFVLLGLLPAWIAPALWWVGLVLSIWFFVVMVNPRLQALNRPSPPQEDLRALRQEAKDPNTSPARLLSLAAQVPREVLENPALALVGLEDPRRGQQIVLTAHEARYTQARAALHARLLRWIGWIWAAIVSLLPLVWLLAWLGLPGGLPLLRLLLRALLLLHFVILVSAFPLWLYLVWNWRRARRALILRLLA